MGSVAQRVVQNTAAAVFMVPITENGGAAEVESNQDRVGVPD